VRDLAHLPPLDDVPSASAALPSLLSSTARDLPRWLLLPSGVALRRRMALPAAAAERLRDVVGFELDRQTPFAADAVAFDARLIGRRAGDAQIDVELVAVPRAALAAAQAQLGDLAGELAGIDVLGADGAPLQVNLLDPAQRRQQADPMQRWNVVLAAVALIATVAMLWQLLQNRRAAADTFEAVATQQAERARRVAAQRQLLVDIVEGQAFLDRTRAGRPTAVEVLDDLSRRLPDSTYLDKLAIEGDRITLIGRSSEASALLDRLEGSKLWRAPALTGALQPDARTGRDIFTLTADLAVVASPQDSPPEARRGAAD
jgi:general secretion pathway protein L